MLLLWAVSVENLMWYKTICKFVLCNFLNFTWLFIWIWSLCLLFFIKFFIFHQMIALQKLWKMFFISSKKLFSFSRYSNFCIFRFSPIISPASHCFRDWSKKNIKVYDVINCLNKNLITHFIWYLEKEKRCDIETFPTDRELNKEHLYGKIMQKMSTKS